MRFSLVSLLVLTGVIGVLCGVFFAVPDTLSVIALVALTISVIPAAAVAGIVYGRGNVRAFSIGALSSMGWLCGGFFILSVAGSLIPSGEPEEVDSLRVICGLVYATIVICGLISMGIRWLCNRGTIPAESGLAKQVPPPTVFIDPRDKAELYAILQGRLANSAMPNGAADKLEEASLPPAD